MTALLAVFRAQSRYWRRHPLQAALTLSGIALGVAVYVAIRLANAGALEAFAEGVKAFSGRATHRVFAPGGRGVPETIYAGLASLPGVAALAPVLEARARLHDGVGEPVTILAFDLAAGEDWLDVGAPAGELPGAMRGAPGWRLVERFLGEPGTALVSPDLASRIGPGTDGRLALWYEGRSISLTAIGAFEPPAGHASAFSHTVLVDPATFQERLGEPGRLDAIELVLAEGAEAVVRARLPAGTRLEPVGARAERVAVMTRAFQTNLEALGLFTLLVAVFLIFNAANFAVVQRKPLIARLRCVGASRRAVLAALIGEALLLGLMGGAAGVALGLWLARWMVEGTSGTVFELFLLSRASSVRVSVDAGIGSAGLALGVLAALLAALLPALEGARIPPVAALRHAPPESRGVLSARGLGWAGLAALAAGAALAWPDHGPLWGALLAATLMAAGAALWMPRALAGCGRLFAPVLGWSLGAAGRLAARNVTRAVGRVGLAAASLMVALSLWLAIAVTIGSFRRTFELWLDQAVRADVYVALAQGPDSGALPDPLLEALRREPWVADLDTLRLRRVVIGSREAVVVGVDLATFSRHASLPMPGADPRRAYREAIAGAALISETLAYPLGLRAGERLALPTPDGERTLPIAAVVQNYSAPSGIVYLHRERYGELFGEESVRSVALWLAPGVSLAEAERALAALPGGERVRMEPNRALRESALRVFDRTFAITALMRGVAGLVAFVAVVSALMALLEERRRILGYLRAIGLSRRKLALSMAVEAVLIACTAAVMSWGAGLLMSVVLIFSVNRRAFGWTLQFHPGQGPYWSLLGVAVGAALLGAVYPIVQAGRLSVSATIREE